MKRLVCGLLIAAALASPMAALAAEFKYGIIDMQHALNDTEEGKKALSRLKSKLETENAVLKGKQDELRKLEEEMTKQGYMLSDAARSEKELKFRKLREEFEKYREEKSGEFARQQKETTEAILKKVLEVVDGYAKAESLGVIFESSARTQGMPGSVIWSDPKNDITPKIIELYNKKFPVN